MSTEFKTVNEYVIKYGGDMAMTQKHYGKNLRIIWDLKLRSE